MASIYELANLAWMAYDWKKNTFDTWERKRTFGPQSGQGFYSELYYNNIKKEAVMSIRGTDFEQKDKKDFLSDLQLGLGRVPSQHKMAKAAYNEFRAYLKSFGSENIPFFFTGHSLGGGLASLLAATLRPTQHPYFVVTFNSPGMEAAYIDSYSSIDILDQTVGRFNYEFYFNKNPFLHIRANGDIISRWGAHIGHVEDVYVNNWGDNKIIGTSRHFAQHSMENMTKALGSLYWYKKDIIKKQIHGTKENLMASRNN